MTTTPDLGLDLNKLDALSGWRALFMLPASAIDPHALLGSISWSNRSDTLVRLYQLPRSIVLLAGGELSNDEGAQLFELYERLRNTGPDGLRRCSTEFFDFSLRIAMPRQPP